MSLRYGKSDHSVRYSKRDYRISDNGFHSKSLWSVMTQDLVYFSTVPTFSDQSELQGAGAETKDEWPRVFV